MSPKKLSQKNLLIVFSTCCLLSLILVAPDLANYSEFYRAIDRVDFALTEITIDLTLLDTGVVHITVDFNVTNPTSFDGIKIPTITCHLRYFMENQLRSLMGVTQTISPVAELEPYQSTVIRINFTIEYSIQQQELARIFLGYLQLHPQQIEWLVLGQYVLQAYNYSLAIQFDPATYITSLEGL